MNKIQVNKIFALRENLTIIIPTLNRPNNLKAQIDFWKLSGYKILILDGSQSCFPVLTEDIPINVNIIYGDKLSTRLLEAASLINTEYCIWLGDDDFLMLKYLDKELAKIKKDKNLEYESIYSVPREFTEKSLNSSRSHLQWKIRYSTLQDSPLERVATYSRQAIDRHFYSIIPTKNFKKVVRAVQPNGYISERKWMRLFVDIFELNLTYLQKTKVSDRVWYLKGNLRDYFSRVYKDEYTLASYTEKNFMDVKVKKWLEQNFQSIAFSSYDVVKLKNIAIETINNKIRVELYVNELHQKQEGIVNKMVAMKKSPKTSVKMLIYRIGKFFYLIKKIYQSRKSVPWSFVLYPKDLVCVRKIVKKNFI